MGAEAFIFQLLSILFFVMFFICIAADIIVFFHVKLQATSTFKIFL